MQDTDQDSRIATVIAAGVYYAIKKNRMEWFKLIFLISLCAIGIQFASNVMRIGYDSTDSESSRSGMGLHIDNKTGCHYLSAKGAGITPRVDANNNHICTGQEP